MKTGQGGIQLIKAFEGCQLHAYKCPADVWTIGYGNTFYKNGTKVKQGDYITQQQSEDLLIDLLPRYEKTVLSNIKVPLTQNQFDALVSFCWNCGSSKTLFSLINNKASEEEIKKFWENNYIKGGGKILPGLVKRRKAEFNLFTLK